jgi:hypothetical protein
VDREPRSRLEAVAPAAGGTHSSLAAAAASALAAADDLRAVVLVEGASDQSALQALAIRHGRDLAGEGVAIVPMGGATNIRHFLELFGPRGLDVKLAGLCDAAEEPGFRRGLEWAGLGSNLARGDLEQLGFFVCFADLEDELIRSLGVGAVEQLIEAEGELGSLRTLQKQPAHRGCSAQEQLRRFMGTRSGRKIHYARLLTEALDLTKVPQPLECILAYV